MGQSFTIKKDDLGPALQVTLRDKHGDPIDITGNLGVQFEMKERQYAGDDDYPRKVDAAATVVDAGTGVVKYQWTSGDTNEIGDYAGEFKVTAADGTPRTTPSPSFITIRVVQSV